MSFPNIIGLRNIIAHDYLGIDAEEIWQIIQDVLISFAESIGKLLEPSGGPACYRVQR